MVVLVTTGLAGAVYLAAAERVRRRRGSWPARRSLAFLIGLGAVAVVLASPLARYDGNAWVHSSQHAVLMGIAPVLLAIGAPVTLCLQALPVPQARQLVAVLQHRSLRHVCGSGAAPVVVEYYALMAIYQLTPLYGLSQSDERVHLAVHAAFFTCGLLFWIPVIGADPTGWRPAPRTRVAMVAAGIPVAALLATGSGGRAFFVANETAALFGVTVLLLRQRSRRKRVVVHRRERLQTLPRVVPEMN